MVIVVVVGVVFHDKPAIFLEYFFFEDQVWNGIHRRQGVGRAGEYIIVAVGGAIDKFEDIVADYFYAVFDVQQFGGLINEFYTGAEFIHICNIPAAAGDKFITVIAGTTKEIKHFERFKIEVVLQNIEKSFLGKVSRWPGWPIVGGRIETPALKFSGDNSHDRFYCWIVKCNCQQRLRDQL